MRVDEIKYLYTPSVRQHGRPVLMTKNELAGRQGFRSVYGFPPDSANQIREQGNLRDLHGIQIYSDELLVDFDNNHEAATKFRQWLMEKGYRFRYFVSGNRSQHYHVDIEPALGYNICYQHKLWVREFATGCDTTIYRPQGLFRLEGTWHEKNAGHRKWMKYETGHRLLKIEEVVEINYEPSAGLEESEARRVLDLMLNRPKYEGNRRCYVWYLAALAYDAGLSMRSAYSAIMQWDETMCHPPLHHTAVWTKVDEAFSQKSARNRR